MDGVSNHRFVRRRLTSLLLWVALVMGVPLWAQSAPPSPDGFAEELRRLWHSYLQAKITEDEGEQRRVTDAIGDLRRQGEGEIFETAAMLFLEEGYQELALGDVEDAKREFLQAAELNPYLWPAYSGLARVKLKENAGIGAYLRLKLKGFRSAVDFQNAFFMLDALFWFLRNLMWAFMVTYILFTILLCYKYFRPFYATSLGVFEERDMGRLYAHLGAVAILLLPFLLGANLFVMAALYIILFIPFFEGRERTAGFMVFLLPLAIPLLAFSASAVNELRSDKLLRLHLSQYLDSDTNGKIAALEATPAQGDLADLSAFTIARLKKMAGRLNEALETYGDIKPSSPYWESAQVNMGNIHLLRKEYTDASEIYKRVLSRNPENALATYNASVVNKLQSDLSEAERLRTLAFSLDKNLRDQSAVMPAEIDVDIDRRAHLFGALKRSFASVSPLDPNYLFPGIIGVVLLLAALLHVRVRNPHLLAKNCAKCGRTFFQSDSPENEWCSQCVNLYIRKDDLPSEAKIRKHEEVSRYNRNSRLAFVIGQVFFPGSGKIFGGQAPAGVLVLLIWVGLLVFILNPVNNISYAFMTFLDGIELVTMILYAVTAGYWAIFGLRPIWQED